MKKLVICYWSLGIGGIGSRLRGLLTELNKKEEVQVYCLLKRKTVEKSYMKSFDKINFLYFSDSIYKGHKLSFLWWLFKNIVKIKPTHALGFLNRFAFVLVISKFWLHFFKRHILKVTIDQPTSTKKHLYQHEFVPIWFPLSIIIFRLIDQITVPTKANKKELRNSFFVPGEKIDVIYSNVKIIDK